MLVGLVCGGALVLVGGAIWGTAEAAARGRLRRNSLAGVRTRPTLASDEAWRTGHRAVVPLCRATGLAGAVIGAAMVVDGVVTRRDDGSVLFWWLFGLGYGGVLVGCVVIAVRASRAASLR